MYKKISKNIEEIIIDNPKTPNHKLRWVNITRPGKKELDWLRRKYRFDLGHLKASSARALAQRPMVERGEDYLFMILHFPTFEKDNIISGEIDFFIGHGFLITLHNGNLKALNHFFELNKKDKNAFLSYQTESSAILLYELLEKLISDSYEILDENSIAINRVEDIIFSQEQKAAASEILYLRRNIINIRKIMQNHKNILKKLMEMESSLVPRQKIKSYYFTLIEHSKRIWDILDNQKEMIEAMHDTNQSFLNYRISDIMKTLTIFSVIVFPLTLLAAIFGMNTVNGMPFIETNNGFWIIIAIMLTGCLGMLFFFERKKWL